MDSISIIEVKTMKALKQFVAFPHSLYKGNSHYVPDMDDDVFSFFSTKKNASLQFADVQPFLAIKDGMVVGRIAGIISCRSNDTWKKLIVRFSYFEFINDYEVSEALLNAVTLWGKERGMDEIQGPMGIHDFDKEGMLIEDFELDGCFMELWNPPYYRAHMERLGFEKAADWLQIRFDVPQQVPPRFQRVADYSNQEFGIHPVHPSKKELMGEYGTRIIKLINEAYAPLYGFAPFSDNQGKDILAQFVPLLDLDLQAIMEDSNGELVGVAVTCRDFSDGIRKSCGSLLPFGWYHILKALKYGHQEKAQLMIIAVKPEMQGMGVNAAMFAHLIKIYNEKGIQWCETNPQLDTNIREISQWKPLNPKTVKRRRCWRKSI